MRGEGQDKAGPQMLSLIKKATGSNAEKNRTRPDCARARKGHGFLLPVSPHPRNARWPERACATRGGKRWRGNPVHCERDPPPPRRAHAPLSQPHGRAPRPLPNSTRMRGEGGLERHGRQRNLWAIFFFLVSCPEKFLERRIQREAVGGGTASYFSFFGREASEKSQSTEPHLGRRRGDSSRPSERSRRGR